MVEHSCNEQKMKYSFCLILLEPKWTFAILIHFVGLSLVTFNNATFVSTLLPMVQLGEKSSTLIYIEIFRNGDCFALK